MCRKPERTLNQCMFEKLVRLLNPHMRCFELLSNVRSQGLTKTIPGTPEGQTPIHEKKSPVFTAIQK